MRTARPGSSAGETANRRGGNGKHGMAAPGTPSTPKPEAGPRNGGILLVETDAELRNAVAICLKTNGWRIYPAEGFEQAREILERTGPEILVLMSLETQPELQGAMIELFRKRQTGRRRGSVILAVDRRPEDAWRRRYHPDAVIFKPFDVRFLSRRIAQLMGEAAHPAG
ncbi:MAG: hypothetical protein JW929_01170 [Anaerolineales bacterium]|nr:hypothetical protein [Anaerolineales bacterium]